MEENAKNYETNWRRKVIKTMSMVLREQARGMIVPSGVFFVLLYLAAACSVLRGGLLCTIFNLLCISCSLSSLLLRSKILGTNFHFHLHNNPEKNWEMRVLQIMHCIRVVCTHSIILRHKYFFHSFIQHGSSHVVKEKNNLNGVKMDCIIF